MKKVRIFLGATALLLTVGATFAFNTHRGFGNSWYLVGTINPVCTLNQACAQGSGGSACSTTVTYYTSSTCATVSQFNHLVAQ